MLSRTPRRESIPRCRVHKIAPDLIVEDGTGAIIRCPHGCDRAEAADFVRALEEWKNRNSRFLGLF